MSEEIQPSRPSEHYSEGSSQRVELPREPMHRDEGGYGSRRPQNHSRRHYRRGPGGGGRRFNNRGPRQYDSGLPADVEDRPSYERPREQGSAFYSTGEERRPYEGEARPYPEGAEQQPAAPRVSTEPPPPDMFLSDLQKKTLQEVVRMAQEVGIENPSILRRHEIMFEILKKHAAMGGRVFGAGVLEILPDNYGFLRLPSYDYLPCPEDVYVSPSQVRRYALKRGTLV
jgi:transcription termination factor Rho